MSPLLSMAYNVQNGHEHTIDILHHQNISETLELSVTPPKREKSIIYKTHITLKVLLYVVQTIKITQKSHP